MAKRKSTRAKATKRTDVMGAVKRAGFRSFEKYVLARSGWTLVEMAEELGLNHAFFLNYHKKWAVETREAPLLQE